MLQLQVIPTTEGLKITEIFCSLRPTHAGRKGPRERRRRAYTKLLLVDRSMQEVGLKPAPRLRWALRKAHTSGGQDYARVYPNALVQDVPLASHAARAQDREPADDGILAHASVRAYYRAPYHRAGFNLRPVEKYAPLDQRPFPDPTAASERGSAPDRGLVLEDASGGHRDRWQNFHTLAHGYRGVNLEVIEVFASADGAGEDVVGGGEVTPRCAYVPPVGARDVRAQAPLGLKLREDLALDGHLLVCRDHIQDLRLEHVDPGVYQACRYLIGGRLLDKAVHQHVVVHLDEPVSRRILDADQHYRRQRI